MSGFQQRVAQQYGMFARTTELGNRQIFTDQENLHRNEPVMESNTGLRWAQARPQCNTVRDAEDEDESKPGQQQAFQ